MKLLNILKYKRPHGSKSEEMMIKEYIDVLPNVYSDAFGNRIVKVGKDNTTMFSCHTDTVHHTSGMQNVMYDKTLGQVFVQHNDCLGADDGAGIIILINLIKAGINGLYVFHREEEIGGNGSYYIANDTPELLDGIERCIAFDRRGTDSVITHQAGERCCSDDFTEELCQQLMQDDMVWFPDNTGSFTDSANYTEIIPECTNLSCGYENEHSANETLDVKFLGEFIKGLLKVNWDNLITKRDPSIPEYDYSFSYVKGAPSFDSLVTLEDFQDFVYEYPDDAAELLMEYSEHLSQAYGYTDYYDDELPLHYKSA